MLVQVGTERPGPVVLRQRLEGPHVALLAEIVYRPYPKRKGSPQDADRLLDGLKQFFRGNATWQGGHHDSVKRLGSGAGRAASGPVAGWRVSVRTIRGTYFVSRPGYSTLFRAPARGGLRT